MSNNVNLGKGIDLSDLVDNNKKIDGRKPDELRKIPYSKFYFIICWFSSF